MFKKFIPYTTEKFFFEVLAEEESKNIVEIHAVPGLNVLQISSAEPKTKVMQAFVESDLNTRRISVFDTLNNQRISCKKVLY